MKQAKKALAAGLFAAALATSSTSRAVVYTEPADAGQTLPTGLGTGTNATTALTAITGTFSGTNDADLYAFTITAPTTFSATTNNAATNTGGQDTALFLFNASGVAIATNDDAAGGLTLDSTLPAGNSLYMSLAAGTYYIGISESGNEAVNSVNQLLFTGYPGGDTTTVRGAAAGVNPTTEGTFNSSSFGGGAGAYEIDLTSAATALNPNAVPEPTTWASLILGGVVAAFTLRRRNRRTA